MERDYLIFAFDFDGTLCKHAFPEIGEIEDVHRDWINLALGLQKSGHKIILWTCRCNTEQRSFLDEAVEFCANQGLVPDAINCNPFDTWTNKPRKIYADYYIDDKAYNVENFYTLVTKLLGGRLYENNSIRIQD